MRQVDVGQSPQAFRRRRYCTARLIVMAGSILALGGISLAPAGSLAAPTAISEILELADVEIGCPDGGSECSPVEKRGTYATIPQFMISSGILLAYIVDLLILRNAGPNWRLM